ncbi:MAG TPA: amino acid permease [Steroidobacteraceae bacterium]|nr:amino acid permease [Steroidobacteraceae bacterium]
MGFYPLFVYVVRATVSYRTRVLPIPALAASTLPAADAARIALPHGSETIITVLSLLITLSLVSVSLLMGPRILLSLAREGWLPPKLADVGAGGSPQAALAATMVGAALLIITGTFDEIVALFAVLIVLNYVAVFLSVFVLRSRLPDAARPFRAWGYPVSTAIVLMGSVGFLLAAIVDNWRSGVTAVVFLSLCIPAYRLAGKSRRALAPQAAPEAT